VTKSVLAIGNCSYDHGNLTAAICGHFDAQVTAASGPKDALEMLTDCSYDLVLVNRILEADGSSGIELIRRLKADAHLAGLPVMLVSNFPDAQQQAVAEGAEPGFGKKTLDSPETIAKLKAHLGPADK
jgi:two-component system chemotaxis response regulator CheY